MIKLVWVPHVIWVNVHNGFKNGSCESFWRWMSGERVMSFFWHENMFVVFVQHGVVTPSVRTYYIDVSERFRSIKVECVFFTVVLNLFVRYAYSVRLSDLHKLQIFMQWLQWYTLFAYDRKLNTYTVKSSVLHVQCHLSIHHQDTRRAIPSFQRNCQLSCQLYRHQCCPGQLAVAPKDVQLSSP